AEATMELYVRSLGVDTLMDISARVNDIVQGAALMAGCGYEIEWDPHPMSLPVRNTRRCPPGGRTRKACAVGSRCQKESCRRHLRHRLTSETSPSACPGFTPW